MYHRHGESRGGRSGETPSDAPRAELLAALIGRSSLEVAVPAALAIVTREPLARAASFEGDLLRALMEVSGEFWARHPGLYDEYRTAVRAAAAARRALPPELRLGFWSPLIAPR